MRIFIYEHTCVTETGTSRLDPLRTEGRAMLTAVVEDFGKLAGVEVVTIEEAGEPAFEAQASRADYSLVIAPEFDGILETRCRWVEESGGRLLGPSSVAVRLAGDKLVLGEYWRCRQVPSPPCRLLLPGQTAPSILWPAVYKPRYGAGSQATFLLDKPAELAAVWQQLLAEGSGGDMLLQPFVSGRPASVAWLIGPHQQLALPPTEQILSADGRFHYQGGALPLPNPLADRAVRLTRRAIDAVDGLLGYVGVDLVLGDAEDGSKDWVIELNPRLTTSYIGLRALARTNLAQLMVDVARGEPVAEPTWHSHVVRFQADGTVTW
jgi:predicted ATP-grasp superfamily ATP-dependent carboligase